MFSPALANLFKMEKKDFTRTRKQSFLGAMLFMISQLKKSLSVEIDIFVGHLNDKLSAGGIPFYIQRLYSKQKEDQSGCVQTSLIGHYQGVLPAGECRGEAFLRITRPGCR